MDDKDRFCQGIFGILGVSLCFFCHKTIRFADFRRICGVRSGYEGCYMAFGTIKLVAFNRF